MPDMTAIRTLVTREFAKSFERARSNGMSELDSSTIGNHPLLIDTLLAIEGSLPSVDDVSAALSKRADELQAIAAANRSVPEWGDICVAMGAVRNAAVAVWNI